MEQNQMSKFCIELEGMMLPDAIAAVVEAWYDSQVLTKFRQSLDSAIEMKDATMDEAILIQNDSTKFKRMKIKLERRGNKIGLRGFLPSKTVKNGYAFQRISFAQPSTPKGFASARFLAQLVIEDLETGNFVWEKWNDKHFIEESALAFAGTYDESVLAPM
jgi:hypothetical protein